MHGVAMSSSVPRHRSAGAHRTRALRPVAWALVGAIAAIWLAAIAGCTTTRAHALPGGAAGVAIDCSGATLTWTHCFRQAGASCPQGYDIVQRSGKGGGHIVGGDLFQLVGDAADHRRLLIRCHPASSPTATHGDPAGRDPGAASLRTSSESSRGIQAARVSAAAGSLLR